MFHGKLSALWQKFLAFSRLDLDAVCRESRKRGLIDFHDYPDGTAGEPWHFYIHRCKRCGKAFII